MSGVNDAERLIGERRLLGLEEQLGHRHRLVGEDPLPCPGDPVQGVDGGQHLHRECLVAGLALLGHDEIADLVGLVDQHLGGALQVPRPVAQRQLGPERLHLGDARNDGGHVLGGGHAHRAQRGAGGGVV
jgi:hypothetical protein